MGAGRRAAGPGLQQPDGPRTAEDVRGSASGAGPLGSTGARRLLLVAGGRANGPEHPSRGGPRDGPLRRRALGSGSAPSRGEPGGRRGGQADERRGTGREPSMISGSTPRPSPRPSRLESPLPAAGRLPEPPQASARDRTARPTDESSDVAARWRCTPIAGRRPGGDPHGRRRGDPDALEDGDLVATRQAESRTAGERIGVRDHRFLGLPDGGLRGPRRPRGPSRGGVRRVRTRVGLRAVAPGDAPRPSGHQPSRARCSLARTGAARVALRRQRPGDRQDAARRHRGVVEEARGDRVLREPARLPRPDRQEPRPSTAPGR